MLREKLVNPKPLNVLSLCMDYLAVTCSENTAKDCTLLKILSAHLLLLSPPEGIQLANSIVGGHRLCCIHINSTGKGKLEGEAVSRKDQKEIIHLAL